MTRRDVARWVGGASALGLLAILFETQALGPHGTLVLADATEVVVPAAAALACGRAGLRSKAHRWGWWLVGASALAWAAGSAIWTVFEVGFGQEVPFPSFADVGYLAAIPLAAAGMLTLSRATVRAPALLRAILDGCIIASALLFVSWAFVLGPVAEASEGDPLSQAIGLAYPVGDILVGSVAVYAATRAPRGDRAPTYLLAGSLFLMAVADSGFAYLTAIGAYRSGGLLDLGWIAGYALMLEAALVVRASDGSAEPDDGLWWPEALAPYAPFVLAIGVAAYVRRARGALDGLLFVSMTLLVLFVAVRQVVTTIDNLELNRRLRAANEDLRRAESFRRQLLRNLSHDLGIALAPLQHHLRRGGTDAVAERQMDQLLRLTQDVRDVSEMDHGGLSLQPTRVDLVGLVRSAVASFHAMTHERGLLVETRFPAYLPIRADAQRLAQVLSHMLTLAIEATPPAGSVLVEVGMARGHARVAVTHDGATTAPADLFEPYGGDGAGLGLYISRGIMEQHGGAMECSTDGETTTIVLALPLESFVLRA